MTGNDFGQRQRFVDQFEPVRDGYVYRKHGVGAAIPVSQTERDRFLSVFDNFQKYGKWGIGIGLLLLITVFAMYTVKYNTEPSDTLFYCGITLILATYMSFHFWVWSLPMRELRGRGTAAPAMSREEVRHLALSRLSYEQIATGAIIGAGPLIGIIISRKDLFSGWNLYWVALGVLTLGASAFTAFKKWRRETVR